MRVITVGRSSQNNVVINNDINVSRVHCQIIQYDTGGFGIADFGSTNGTFVNGRKITGEVRLNWNDTVQIGNTYLQWQNYFSQSKSKPNYTWIYGLVAAITLAIITVGSLLFYKYHSQRDIIFSGEYPPIKTIAYYEDGESYQFDAYEGLVDIYFKKETSYRNSSKIIEQTGGKIVAQNKRFNYFLVKTDKETDFINRMQQYSTVEYVFLCMPKYLQSVYTIDAGDHAKMVRGMAEKCSPGNITIIEKDAWHPLGINTNIADKHIRQILDTDKNKTKEPKFINMSYGAGLKPLSWSKANDFEKIEYRVEYKKDMDKLLAIIKNNQGNDNYMLIQAAGNYYIPNLEKEILNDYTAKLSPEDYELLKKHYRLVTVTDDRWNKESGLYKYSNRLSEGTQHPLVINVNISHLENKGDRGTSAGAPYVACYLDDIAHKHSLTATEAGQIATTATTNGTLDTHKIYAEAKQKEESKKYIENQINRTAPQQTETYNMRDIDVNTTEIITPSGNTTTYTYQSNSNNCLQHRLVNRNKKECLELKNTCNVDLLVEGRYINAIVPRGGYNDYPFKKIVNAYSTGYVEGFSFEENTYEITKIEVLQKKTNTHKSENPQSNELVGTKWKNIMAGQIEFISSSTAKISDFIRYSGPDSYTVTYEYNRTTRSGKFGSGTGLNDFTYTGAKLEVIGFGGIIATYERVD